MEKKHTERRGEEEGDTNVVFLLFCFVAPCLAFHKRPHRCQGKRHTRASAAACMLCKGGNACTCEEQAWTKGESAATMRTENASRGPGERTGKKQCGRPKAKGHACMRLVFSSPAKAQRAAEETNKRDPFACLLRLLWRRLSERQSTAAMTRRRQVTAGRENQEGLPGRAAGTPRKDCRREKARPHPSSLATAQPTSTQQRRHCSEDAQAWPTTPSTCQSTCRWAARQYAVVPVASPDDDPSARPLRHCRRRSPPRL